MVAEYIRLKFPGPATEAVLAMATLGIKESITPEENLLRLSFGFGKFSEL